MKFCKECESQVFVTEATPQTGGAEPALRLRRALIDGAAMNVPAKETLPGARGPAFVPGGALPAPAVPGSGFQSVCLLARVNDHELSKSAAKHHL